MPFNKPLKFVPATKNNHDTHHKKPKIESLAFTVAIRRKTDGSTTTDVTRTPLV